ncbi:MAG: phosphodiester glycosidase family protein [Actinomycetota bacterium]|nr:phosphodiester glycosidase family protein [Actinomycetota bacterium]
MSPMQLARRVEALPRRRCRLERLRIALADGARTTVHVVNFETDSFMPRVVAFEKAQPLARWCRRNGVRHAVVGGFFARPRYQPLGDLRIGGEPRPSVAFDQPWGSLRACVQVTAGRLRIARRDELSADPDGDLLQAGPLLVSGGRSAIGTDDEEGFSAGSHQFDSDITLGRYPRAALAIAGPRLLAVACDGRTERDAGMTLAELADMLVKLGASDALNLDGGGSASLVHSGRLRNRPREVHGADILGGRAVVTAIVFEAL